LIKVLFVGAGISYAVRLLGSNGVDSILGVVRLSFCSLQQPEEMIS